MAPGTLRFIAGGRGDDDTVGDGHINAVCRHAGIAVQIGKRVPVKVPQRSRDHLRPQTVSPFQAGHVPVLFYGLLKFDALGLPQNKGGTIGRPVQIAFMGSPQSREGIGAVIMLGRIIPGLVLGFGIVVDKIPFGDDRLVDQRLVVGEKSSIEQTDQHTFSGVTRIVGGHHIDLV